MKEEIILSSSAFCFLNSPLAGVSSALIVSAAGTPLMGVLHTVPSSFLFMPLCIICPHCSSGLTLHPSISLFFLASCLDIPIHYLCSVSEYSHFPCIYCCHFAFSIKITAFFKRRVSIIL